MNLSQAVTACTPSFNIQNSTIYPQCIYLFYVDLRTNGGFCPIQHSVSGFYKGDGKCSQRGLHVQLKGLKNVGNAGVAQLLWLTNFDVLLTVHLSTILVIQVC